MAKKGKKTKTLKCVECEGPAKKLQYDPRVPPLEEDDCLCAECFVAAAGEVIEDNLSEIAGLKRDIERAVKEG